MKEIDPITLRSLLQKDEVALLDVREPHEHNDYNIGGQLIPMDELMSSLQNIPKNRPVVVYCKKGIRSQIAIQRLSRVGFDNLVNLSGGIEEWKKQFSPM